MHETLRICAVLLQPFMPRKSAQILEALGVSAPLGAEWASAVPGGPSFFSRREMTIQAEITRYDAKKALLFPNLSAER